MKHSALLSILIALLFAPQSFAAGPGVPPGALEAAKKRMELLEQERVERDRQAIDEFGFRPWAWSNRDTRSPDNFVILPLKQVIRYDEARAFIKALATNKSEIMDLYRDTAPVTDAEYVMLARMAVGFLGAESEFFTSTRYTVKEACIFCFAVAKWAASVVGLADNDTMSRGPIQMKHIPVLIEQKYNITPADLNDPDSAARAIMGYLIEALTQLKKMAKNRNLTYINEETYVDYLPYIYFGSARKLIDGSATPDKNLYIQKMRQYMAWVEVYSRENVQVTELTLESANASQ